MTTSRMRPLAISAATLTTALGRGYDAHWQALREERTGLATCAFPGAQSLRTWSGEVRGLAEVLLPRQFARFDCRNNRLAELALAGDGFMAATAALVARYGAHRIGVYLGTSTSGLEQTERAYRERARHIAEHAGAAADQDASLPDAPLPDWYDYAGTQNTFSLAAFVRARCGLRGPAQVISTACSSSAKVFASAMRAMQAGVCDAALVGGADSLCLTTLFGFNALQLLASDICRPADTARAGLSIGEAAGFAVLQWADAANGSAQVLVTGIGESSDAHHMSAPDPEGAGAAAAMAHALARGGATTVDYVNLHGTATPANDLVEDKALCAVLGTQVPCSSTKGWTGHTLGAAGIVEILLTSLCLREGWLPRSLNTLNLDERLHANVLLASTSRPLRRALSNSFGFGGSNCAVLLEQP